MASKSKTKALSRLSREQFSFDEFTEFMAQVNGEKNDRGACILLAINVETALDGCLERIIRPDENQFDRLYGQDGPLGTFSRKITMAVSLGIIGEEHRANLDLIRQVRNAFAHAKRPITFDTPEVAAVCQDLTLLAGMRRQDAVFAALHFQSRGI